MSTRSPSIRPNYEALPPPRRLPYDPGPEPRSLTLGGIAFSVLVALVVAGIVYAASHKLPATYQATSMFRVSVPNQGGVNDSTVTAANDIASQYAQLASSSPVLNAAAATLQVPASTLSNEISGSTVSAENLVQLSANGKTPSQANARAQAVGTAMVNYLDQLNVQQGSNFYKSANGYLAPLDGQIAALRRQISFDRPAAAAADRQTLQTLLTQRETEASTLATDAAGGQPSLQLVTNGGNASQTAPKPSEYALIGFVVALLITLRAVYVLGVPRLPVTFTWRRSSRW